VGEREVQIKAAQKDSVDLKACDGGRLLVLKIEQSGEFDEVYNGDADRVWHSLSRRKVNRAGEIPVSLKQLRALQKQVREDEKITRQDR
jgi:hypothetical protein